MTFVLLGPSEVYLNRYCVIFMLMENEMNEWMSKCKVNIADVCVDDRVGVWGWSGIEHRKLFNSGGAI